MKKILAVLLVTLFMFTPSIAQASSPITTEKALHEAVTSLNERVESVLEDEDLSLEEKLEAAIAFEEEYMAIRDTAEAMGELWPHREFMSALHCPFWTVSPGECLTLGNIEFCRFNNDARAYVMAPSFVKIETDADTNPLSFELRVELDDGSFGYVGTYRNNELPGAPRFTTIEPGIYLVHSSSYESRQGSTVEILPVIILVE